MRRAMGPSRCQIFLASEGKANQNGGHLCQGVGSRVPNQFWFAKYQEPIALWEYSHRRDARIGKIARWFIVVGSEGLPKKPKMTAGREEVVNAPFITAVT